VVGSEPGVAVVVIGKNERVVGASGEECHVGERIGVVLGSEGRLERVVSGTNVCKLCSRDWEKAGIEIASSNRVTPSRCGCGTNINNGGIMNIYVMLTAPRRDEVASLGSCFHLGLSERKKLPRIDTRKCVNDRSLGQSSNARTKRMYVWYVRYVQYVSTNQPPWGRASFP